MRTITTFIAAGLTFAALVGAGVTYAVTHPRGQVAVAAAPSAEDGCETLGQCAAHAGAAAAPKPKGPRILAFSSATCVACKKMEPVVAAAERACAATRDVTHVDVDADQGAALASTYAVSSIPAWLSIDSDGNEVSRMVGVQPEWRIEEAIEEVSGTRCAAVDRPPG